MYDHLRQTGSKKWLIAKFVTWDVLKHPESQILKIIKQHINHQ